MKTAMDIETIREGAAQLRKASPDLFDSLAERDDALVSGLLHLAARIPEPEQLPTLRIPFADLFDTESCTNRWFQAHAIREELGIELPESFRRFGKRAEWLCENGIRLRKSRLREIA